jgi:Ca2+-binding RTX toxin-like protein
MRFPRYLNSLRRSLKRNAPAPKSRQGLGLELLEDRTALSTLSIINGVLTYTAGNGIANNLTIALAGTTYTFTDTAETISAPNLAGNGTNSVSFSAGLVTSLNLNLGDGNDTLTVRSTANAMTVNAGAGRDTINLGNQVNGIHTLDRIQGPVTVRGEDQDAGGVDQLNLNDQGAAAARSYVVTATSITRVAPGPNLLVNYQTIEGVDINAGQFDDTFTVRSSAAGTAVELSGGRGGDTFTVGSVGNSLDAILGTVTVRTQGGDDALNLNDQGASSGKSYLVTPASFSALGTVQRSGTASIRFDFGMEDVELRASNFDNTIAVQGVFTGTDVTIVGGTARDSFSVGSTANTLSAVDGELTLLGQGGSDSLTLNDQGTSTAQTFTITPGGVTRGGDTISYTGLESLVLNAGSAADTINVPSLIPSFPVTINAGGGRDIVNVGVAGALSNILAGTLTVHGQGDLADLNLNDQAQLAAVSYTIESDEVRRTASGVSSTIAYDGLGSLVVRAGAANDTFTVVSTLAGTSVSAFGGNGADTFNVGRQVGLLSFQQTLDNIQGALTLDGQGNFLNLPSPLPPVFAGPDVVNLNDRAEATGHQYVIQNDRIDRDGVATISYAGVEGLGLDTGSSNDTFTVRSTAAGSLTTVNAAAGNDVFNVGLITGITGTLESIDGELTLHGATGADELKLFDSEAVVRESYTIRSDRVERVGAADINYATMESLTLDANNEDSTIAVVSTAAATPVTILAGFGNDTIRVGDAGNPATLLGTVTVNGEGGIDTLDYTAFTSAVRVNLGLGTATALAGGISGIENASGGLGNDILVGKAGANVLRGGAGRDILIGAGGADQLFGGSGEDILIGGSTVHDATAAALESIMDEWDRTDRTFDQRVNNLLLGTGQNDGIILDLSKIINDGAVDTLDGDEVLFPTASDWFFAGSEDVRPDFQAANDRLN